VNDVPGYRSEQAASVAGCSGSIIETDIPARLDALPFGAFHTLVIMALGITWILDGLEVTLAGALSGELKDSSGLGLSNEQVGLAGSCYLAGAVLGAFFFGWLTDRLGRKRLFTITLSVYLLATAATALSWNFWSFALFRFVTGAGIGGEYTAINSTIQELIPARFRGWTDLAINGSFSTTRPRTLPAPLPAPCVSLGLPTPLFVPLPAPPVIVANRRSGHTSRSSSANGSVTAIDFDISAQPNATATNAYRQRVGCAT